MWLIAAETTTSGGAGLPGYVIGLLSALGIAVTALATYLGVRRLNSGGIKTSTAESLWNESNNMRKDLSDRLAAAEARVEAQAKEIEIARSEALAWQQRAAQMEADTARMKKQITTLQRQVRELRGNR